MKRNSMDKRIGVILWGIVLVLGLMTALYGTANANEGNPYSALVNTTTPVTFNGIQWYIIKDDSTAEGTLTLFAKDPIDRHQYNDSSESDDANLYSSSQVKNYLDGLTAAGGSFAGVADAIRSVDLTDVNVSGAQLYLLSKSEAEALPEGILKCNVEGTKDDNYWWLRTTHDTSYSAKCVKCADGDTGYAQDVTFNLRVRPALQLDLSMVTFDSANKVFFIPYPVWVGGEQVTSVNKDDVLGNADEDATVKYTPAQAGSAAVLTLDGANISGGSVTIGNTTYYAAIYTTEDLTIKVTADSSVTSPDVDSQANAISCGIYTDNSGNLTITGSDTLTATAGKSENWQSFGVYADGNVIIEKNAKLKATGGVGKYYSIGALANGGFTVNGTVIASGGNAMYSMGIRANSGVIVNGTLTATGGDAENSSYGVYAREDVTVHGTLTARGGTISDDVSGDSYGVYTQGKVTVSGELTAIGGKAAHESYGVQASSEVEVNAGAKLNATGSEAKENSYGVKTSSSLIVNGTLIASGGSVSGGEFGVSYGVSADGNVTVTGRMIAESSNSYYGCWGVCAGSSVNVSGTLTAKGGSVSKDNYCYSYGVYANGNLTVSGTLTAESGSANIDHGDSYGAYVKGSVTVNGVLTAISGNASKSYGVFNSNDTTVSADASLIAAGNTQAINSTVKNSVAGFGWADTSGVQDKTEIPINTEGKTIVYKKVALHRHNFTYSASGATVTAACGNKGCWLKDSQAILTIGAPVHTIYEDGKDAAAVITDKDDIRGEAAISYYKANDAGTDKTGDPLTGAPADVGTYWAEITIGTDGKSATAYVIYPIAKAAGPDLSPEDAKAACDIDYLAETVKPGKDGHEVSVDGVNAAAAPASITAVLDGTGEKKVYARAAENDSYLPGPWAPVVLTERPAAPTGLTTENATDSTSQDGKIKGTTSGMEYSGDGGKTWEDASTDETSVVPGTYLVRTKAESNAPYGKSAEVTVGDNLVEAKVAAQRELEAYRNSKDASAYDEEGITGLDSAKASGDAAIDKAADEAAVKAALAAAKEAIDAVKTKAQKKQEEDIAAAEAVKKLIDALPAAEKVVVSDKVTIEAARKAYDALTDAQKKLVNAETLKHLTDDEAALKTLIEADEKAKADVAAADAVKKLIDALSAADEVAVSDKDAIEVARKAYDALTDDQKKLIDADTLKHLTDDEAALKAAQEAEKAVQEKAKADQDAADTVKKLIDAMPAADKVVTGDKEAIEAARKAYDALTDDQKKLIDADALKHLTDDEAALKAAQEAEEKAKKEQAAADAVKKLIDAMPTADKVMTGDKEAIEAARKAYDALTDDQKKLIDADTLKHLTDEEEALKAAQEAEEKAKKDQAAADAVKALIDALPEAEKVTTGDKNAIEAARKAYDALTDDQKKLVDEKTLKYLTDDEAALKELSADPVVAFVTRLYKLILGREPDEEGLKGWSDALKSKVATAAQIIDGFVRSPEFVQQNLGNGASVDILYRTMLDREADPEGKAGWTDAMDKGYTLQHIINGFCGSVEFNALCEKYGIEAGTISVSPVTPQNPRDKIEAFVRRCYSLILSREADEEGLKGWSDALEQRVAAAAQIIDGFIRSPEYINRNLSNDASVDILYRTMLDREADPAGKTGWVDALGQGFTLQHIINGFCGSAEFTAICNNYGIVAGNVAVSGAVVKREAITPEGEDAAPVVVGEYRSEFINEEKIKAFVEHCYKAVFGREGDAEGIENYTKLILNGRKMPKKVAYEFIFSPEFQEKLPGNEEFIRILYRLYFDREPGADELAGWVQMLENGASLEEIVNGFAGSSEFKAIVKAMKE